MREMIEKYAFWNYLSRKAPKVFDKVMESPKTYYGLEAGGLATLMAPSVANKAGHEFDQDTYDNVELGGLSALLAGTGVHGYNHWQEAKKLRRLGR